MGQFVAGQSRTGQARPLAALATAVPAAVVLTIGSAVFAVALQRYPPTWLVALGRLAGAARTPLLALSRYEMAVALGVLLLGVVKFEPAPPDAVFGVVIGVAAVTGRFQLTRCPLMMVVISSLFLILNILSTIEAVNPVVAARYFAITLYLVVLALFLTSFVNSEHRARLVVWAYLVSALLSAVLGSVSLMTGAFADLLTLNERAAGLFQDPNVYGPFLCPIILILIAELIRPTLLRIPRKFMAVALAVLLVGLLFSYSRGDWINLAAGILIMFAVTTMRRGGGRQAAALTTALVLAAIVVLGVVSVTGSLDFLQERAQRQGYDSERFAAQRQGIEYGETDPVGIGPGEFEVLQFVVSHNTYVRTLSEQGFLGLSPVAGHRDRHARPGHPQRRARSRHVRNRLRSVAGGMGRAGDLVTVRGHPSRLATICGWWQPWCGSGPPGPTPMAEEPTPAASSSLSRRVARNTAVRSSAEIVAKLASVGFYVVMARKLGEESFGDFMFALSLSSFLLLLAGFGLDDLITRDAAKHPESTERLWSNTVALKILTGALLIGGAALAVNLAGYSTQARTAVYIVGAANAIEVLSWSWHAVFASRERLDLTAVSILAQRIFTAGVGIALLMAGYGLVAASLVFLVGAALNLAIAHWQLMRAPTHPRSRRSGAIGGRCSCRPPRWVRRA